MFKYAQINDDGYVISISYLSGEVKADNLIALSNEDIVGVGWHFSNGNWEEPEAVAQAAPLMQQMNGINNIEMLAQQIENLQLTIQELNKKLSG